MSCFYFISRGVTISKEIASFDVIIYKDVISREYEIGFSNVIIKKNGKIYTSTVLENNNPFQKDVQKGLEEHVKERAKIIFKESF